LVEGVTTEVKPVDAQGIQDFREAYGLSIRDLAKLLSVSHTAVKRWEQGGTFKVMGDSFLFLKTIHDWERNHDRLPMPFRPLDAFDGMMVHPDDLCIPAKKEEYEEYPGD